MTVLLFLKALNGYWPSCQIKSHINRLVQPDIDQTMYLYYFMRHRGQNDRVSSYL